MTKTISERVRCWMRPAVVVLASMAALGGCAHGVKMNADTRARMARAPAIHVVHYVTPDPQIHPPAAHGHWGVRINLHQVPAPSEVRERMGLDLTTEIAKGVAHGLRTNGKLANLVAENRSQPLPPDSAIDHYRARYRKGMVLEVWLRQWSFNYLPVDFKTYSLILDARTRLIDLSDGQVLWDTASCGFGSAGDYRNRLVLSDLRSNPKSFRGKIGTIARQARDSCSLQVSRRYLESR